MLPQFGVVLAARRMEVGRLGKIFKRLARDRTLRGEISVLFIYFYNNLRLSKEITHLLWRR